MNLNERPADEKVRGLVDSTLDAYTSLQAKQKKITSVLEKLGIGPSHPDAEFLVGVASESEQKAFKAQEYELVQTYSNTRALAMPRGASWAEGVLQHKKT